MGVVGVTTAVVVGAAAIGGAAAAIGCGGGDDGDGGGSNNINVAGDWIGTWSGSGGIGNISLTLTQTNTSVSGPVSITGSQCISTGALSGIVAGNTLDSEIVSGSGSDIVSFRANVTST